MDVTFRIGAAEYAVPGEEAHRLEGVIRDRCVDLHGRPLSESARACLEIADLIREELQSDSPEPIHLAMPHVEGLCEHVTEAEEIASVAPLTDLCDALRRYRDDS